MNKDKLQLLSPLFLRYQTDYEKNPRSHVFAPLAEMYRKTGMVEKAMDILSQGIKYHPDYLMGHLGLAFCYYDIKQYRLAFTTLKPLVETNRDNIRLQKLFVDTCIALNNKEEALNTCKYLLFINPKDKEIAQKLAVLEKEIEEYYKHEHHPIYIPSIELSGETKKHSLITNDASEREVDYDSWVTVNLVSDDEEVESKDVEFEKWNVKKITDPDLLKDNKPAISSFNPEVVVAEKPKIDAEAFEPTNIQEIAVANIDSIYEEDEAEERSFIVDLKKAPKEEKSQIFTSIQETKKDETIITHTLVNLYCGQGHFDKALEVLEKILELNPTDTKSIVKKEEILALLSNDISSEQVDQEAQDNLLFNQTEEDGRKSLMDIIDQKVGLLPIDEINDLKPVKNGKIMPKPVKQVVAEEKKIAETITSNLLALKEHPEIKGPKSPIVDVEAAKVRDVEAKLNKFLANIQKRALDIQGRF